MEDFIEYLKNLRHQFKSPGEDLSDGTLRVNVTADAPQDDPSPWTSPRAAGFAPAHRPSTLADVVRLSYGNSPQTFNQSMRQMLETLSAVKQNTIGEPEALLTGETGQVSTPFGVVSYPKGLPDTLAAIPLLGRGVEMAGGAIREVKPFFSQLWRTLEERMPAAATADQILNIARKGSKAEELAYSGLEDMMRPGQKYTKREILEHLDKNAPELHEKMIGGKKLLKPEDFASRREYDNYIVENGPLLGIGTNRANMPGEVSPKFTAYTLPGGENHRELVVTLPNAAKAPPVDDFGTLRERGWKIEPVLDEGRTRFKLFDENGAIIPNPRGIHLFNAEDDARTAALNWVNNHPQTATERAEGAFHRWVNQAMLTDIKANMDPEEFRDMLLLHPELWDRGLTGNMTRAHFNALPPEYQNGMRRDFARAQHDFTPEELGNAALPKEDYHVPNGHAYGDPELDANRLFHVRMNDRDAGKTLHIDEIQSDWHQAAKRARDDEIDRLVEGGMSEEDAAKKVPTDFGYKVDKASLPRGMSTHQIANEEEAQQASDMIGLDHGTPHGANVGDWVLEDENGEALAIAAGHTHQTRQQALDFFRETGPEGIFQNSNGVPDAPFKKTWHELGMKRALQEAADGNYDRVTWTTGAQQADRYRISNHVDKLEWRPKIYNPKYDGTKDGELMGRKDGRYVFHETMPVNKLKQYIGKEPAERLLAAKPKLTVREDGGHTAANPMYNVVDENDRVKATYRSTEDAQFHIDSEPHSITGDDMEVGAEGMKGFYDKMLPDFMNRYAKKWGGRVEKSTIGGNMSSTKLATKIMDSAGIVGERDELVGKWLKEASRQVGNLGKRPLDIFQDMKTLGYLTGGTPEQINVFKTELQPFQNMRGSHEAWQLKITPQMREELKRGGQALFAGAPLIPLANRERQTDESRPQQ